jgi:paraquat-inducible protein B
MALSRIAWLLTVLACLVAAALLWHAHFRGYAAVTIAVGAAAGINLF